MGLTNKQILKKAIEKAIKNGFIPKSRLGENVLVNDNMSYESYNEEFLSFQEYFRVIFSHDFAKAFWGEELVVNNIYPIYLEIPDKEAEIPAWQYHLQQMVLEEDPIKYLEKYV